MGIGTSPSPSSVEEGDDAGRGDPSISLRFTQDDNRVKKERLTRGEAVSRFVMRDGEGSDVQALGEARLLQVSLVVREGELAHLFEQVFVLLLENELFAQRSPETCLGTIEGTNVFSRHHPIIPEIDGRFVAERIPNGLSGCGRYTEHVAEGSSEHVQVVLARKPFNDAIGTSASLRDGKNARFDLEYDPCDVFICQESDVVDLLQGVDRPRS